jgi:hypothetical protein
MATSMSRRHLLRLTTIAAASVPLAALLSRTARAADAPLISESDPTAKAVSYVEDVAKAKAAKPGSRCDNCTLYTGAANAPSGPCALFPGKQVKAAGWCSAWAAKA